jgi:hypothetical protein
MPFVNGLLATVLTSPSSDFYTHPTMIPADGYSAWKAHVDAHLIHHTFKGITAITGTPRVKRRPCPHRSLFIA